AEPAPRGGGVSDITEKALGLVGHERRLVAFREAMEREEAVQRLTAFCVAGPAKARTRRALETTELATQLVPLLLSETLNVRLAGRGERDPRAGHETFAARGVAGACEFVVEYIECRGVTGDVLAAHARCAVGDDPARDRSRDHLGVLGRGHAILFIGQLAAR